MAQNRAEPLQRLHGVH
eukprot:gene3329-biopygen11976